MTGNDLGHTYISDFICKYMSSLCDAITVLDSDVIHASKMCSIHLKFYSFKGSNTFEVLLGVLMYVCDQSKYL